MGELSVDERFFFDHAGWSEPPGREACARELAAAEAWARGRGYRVVTEDDPYVMDDDAGSVELVASGEYVNLVVVLVSDEYVPCPHNVLGSLGGVVVSSEDDPYVRVVGAELAAEAMTESEGSE